MTRFALLASLVLCSAPALAQAQSQPQGAPQSPGEATPQLPLAAMRHQQPTQSDVTQREEERFGSKNVQQEQSREQKEVRQLYDEVMRRSEPAKGQGQE